MLVLAPSPGFIYLIRNIHRILLPPLVIYLSAYLLDRTLDISVPQVLIAVACIFSFPLILLLSIKLTEIRARRDALLHCAELAPEVPSNIWFGLDTAMHIRHSFLNEFFVNHIFEWSQLYGPTFQTNVFGERKYYTAEPDHIKSMLVTDFHHFPKGDEFRFQMKAVFGSGILNADGDHWKHRRGLARPFFSKSRIGQFESLRLAEDVIRQIETRNDEGYPIDFQDLVQRFTLDSTADFVLGKNFNTVNDTLAYPPTLSKRHQRIGFANALGESLKIASVRAGFRGGFATAWPLFELRRDDIEAHMTPLRKVLDPIIQEAFERKRLGVKIEDSKDTVFLNHLVNITDDPDMVTDEILNVLLAGRDTTSTALTFAIYELSRHPDVLQCLRHEILSILGNTGKPSHEDVKKMKYLKAFLNEVMRLYPPIGLDTRECVKPTLWSSKSGGPPIYVPENTNILISIFVMHRRKDLWGPDAHEFDPNRFLDERLDKYLVPNPGIFLPFNAGPRTCLGQELAYNNMSLLLIRILQRFSSIVLCQKASVPHAFPTDQYRQSIGTDGTDEVRIKTGIALFVAGGLWVKMYRSSDNNIEPIELDA